MSTKSILLVVDDHCIIRQVVRRTLCRLHPNATMVDGADVGTALRAMQQCDVTAILTDIYLPDGNGRQVLAAAQSLLPGLPVVCMSSDPTVEAGVLAAGAAAFLRKPFTFDELQAVLQQLM